jgi:hypothetical protein
MIQVFRHDATDAEAILGYEAAWYEVWGYFSDPIIRLDKNTIDTRSLVWVLNRTNS